MNKRWLPTAAGILDLLAGIGALAGAGALGFAATVVAHLPPDEVDEFPMWLVANFLGLLAAVAGLLGVLAIIGGVFAILRKRWGWALAGAIAATFCSPPFGLPAIILTAIAEDEIRSGG